MSLAARSASGAAAPEDVHAPGAANGAAGILTQDEPVDGLPADPTVTRGRTGRMVRTNASAPRGNTRGSVAMDRPGVRVTPRLPNGAPGITRKNTYDSLWRSTRGCSYGIRVEPLAQDAHGHRLAGDPALVDEQLRDAPIGAPVRRRVPEPQLAAAGKAERPAALDLHEEDVDRIPGPRQRLGEPARPPAPRSPPGSGRSRAACADRSRGTPQMGTAYSALGVSAASMIGS